ncbi:MAG: hypothetical protein QM715_05375 [Nibricoccus sp.]
MKFFLVPAYFVSFLLPILCGAADLPPQPVPALLSWGNEVWQLQIDPATGAIASIQNKEDPLHMNWLREAGRWEKTKWIANESPEAKAQGQWGLVETAHTGLLHSVKSRQVLGNVHETIYEAPSLTVIVRRELRDDGLHESYSFKNNSIIDLVLPLGSVSIVAPLFDQYPGATLSLTSRCHTHLWMGGSTAWINATRMGAAAPHLGLIVTEGALEAYSQRGATYSDRGTFLLHPAAMTVKRGTTKTISWRLFWHTGWDDFFAKISREKNVVRLTAQRYTVQAGEPIEIMAEAETSLENATLSANGKLVPAKLDGKTLRATIPTSEPGEMKIELARGESCTWLRANVVASPEALIDARVRFIVRHQQRHAPGEPLDGAYLAYDNETGQQIYATSNDHNAGRERVAMGVLGALYLPQCRDDAFREELTASLRRYADFVARELEDDSGTVFNNVGRQPSHRLYNYPWIAHLHLALYRATREADQLERMVRVLRSYYAHGGAKYYAIGIQVTDTLATLAEAGRDAERAELLANFRAHADNLLRNGTNYPPFEVNYEQSIVAPAVQLLLEVYRATGEVTYLDGAKKQLRVLEAFAGEQPDHRLNKISIRHWDDFWFGKIRTYGDTFPHYWSAINAMAFAHYAKATGEKSWQERARTVTWGNLSLFTPAGQGSAAHVYAFSTNGQCGERNDPWANDQDWALAYLLMVSKIGAQQ